MSLRPVLVLLLLAGCSRGEDADLQYIGEARSLAAEWALINEQSNEGHLTTSYVKTMRRSLREQLHSTAKSLSQPQSRYGQEIAWLESAPDGAPPAELRAHAGKLKQIEDSLESA
ncbi:MAG: hypothetical protein ACJ8F4_08690 [Sphingomonas sp.]